MKRDRLMDLSVRWFTLLQRLYPADFRDDMGKAVVEAYMDRARDGLKTGGRLRLAMLWIRALADFFRNGFGEWARPGIAWRRSGDWGRDAELVTRRLLRSPAFVAATVGTLTLGLGMFAVVYTAVDKILLEPIVRLAIGANHRRVLQLVLREAVMLVGLGLLIGVPGIYAAGRLIRGVLIGVSPSHPFTLLGVAAGLTLVSLATCYVPARRVLKIDPAQLFREE